MADIYLDSGAGGTPDGLAWATAWLTLAALISGETLSSSDTIWVKSDHAEDLPGYQDYLAPQDPGMRMICVAAATSNEPPVAGDLDIMDLTYAEGWTGNPANGFAFSGCWWIYGCSFFPGDGLASEAGAYITLGTNVTVDSSISLNSCNFGSRGTHGNPTLTLGGSSDANRMELIDCIWKPGGTGQEINMGQTHTYIRGLTINTDVATPGYAFKSNNKYGFVEAENCDISNVGTGIITGSADSSADLILRNSKIPASPTLNGNTNDQWAGARLWLYNCNNGDVNYDFAKADYSGELTTDVAGGDGIQRTNGAKHNDTAFSWKIVTTAHPILLFPFKSEEINVWNDVIGSSVTATVQIIGSELFQNDDVWINVQYLGTDGEALGLSATSRVDFMGTPANLPNVAATWDANPATHQDMQLAVTITPETVGWIHIKVCVAKPSVTLYVDPMAVLS